MPKAGVRVAGAKDVDPVEPADRLPVSEQHDEWPGQLRAEGRRTTSGMCATERSYASHSRLSLFRVTLIKVHRS